MKNFLQVAAKYPSFNFNIDDNSVKDSIKVTYNMGPSVELVKKEFEEILKAQTQIDSSENSFFDFFSKAYDYACDIFKPAYEPPTEVCSSYCHVPHNGLFKINAAINALQQKYNKIIKDFDTTMPGKVVMTYWKVELPDGQAPTDQNPDWEYVRHLVEGSMPYQIQFKLCLSEETNRQGLAENVVN